MRKGATFSRAGVTLLLSRTLVLCAALCALSAEAGEILAAVKSRGVLRCGVSEGVVGFSAKDASGRWSGFDADFCRAVAAAAIGNADKVEFIPLSASARFPALQGKMIDVLVRETTWTLGREIGLKARFAGILLYDGQAFMVPRKNAPRTVAALNGATICVEKGATPRRTSSLQASPRSTAGASRSGNSCVTVCRLPCASSRYPPCTFTR